MRSRLSTFCWLVLVFALAWGASDSFGQTAKGKKGKNSAPTDTGTAKKIDLLTAPPGSVDLATIDPTLLDLTKESIQRIDLAKWDLSKIDVSKVKDPLAAKWIQKVQKEKKALEKTLSNYAPGDKTTNGSASASNE